LTPPTKSARPLGRSSPSLTDPPGWRSRQRSATLRGMTRAVRLSLIAAIAAVVVAAGGVSLALTSHGGRDPGADACRAMAAAHQAGMRADTESTVAGLL